MNISAPFPVLSPALRRFSTVPDAARFDERMCKICKVGQLSEEQEGQLRKRIEQYSATTVFTPPDVAEWVYEKVCLGWAFESVVRALGG